MAARSYFGKSARELTLSEGAMLAALAKGPSYFNPEAHPDRAEERLAYVLRRMQEDGAITAEDEKTASALPSLVRYEPPQAGGSYFTDYVAREMRTASDLRELRGASTVHSTLDPDLQRAAETALQEGLARYEQDARRVDFRGPETNLAAEVEQLDAKPPGGKPAWQQALERTQLSISDVHWNPAVVIGKGEGRPRDGSIRVGLADGTVLPLSGPSSILRGLKPYDVVLVRVTERSRKGRGGRAELRVRPAVQGAVVAIENRTGRILWSEAFLTSRANSTARRSRSDSPARH
jgi:membrane carboxypeptidase/penicillin-binding protein